MTCAIPPAIRCQRWRADGRRRHRFAGGIAVHNASGHGPLDEDVAFSFGSNPWICYLLPCSSGQGRAGPRGGIHQTQAKF
jgi:hypothetical protein